MVPVVEMVLAAERRDDGHVERRGELGDVLRRLRAPAAAAEQQQRPLRRATAWP